MSTFTIRRWKFCGRCFSIENTVAKCFYVCIHRAHSFFICNLSYRILCALYLLWLLIFMNFLNFHTFKKYPIRELCAKYFTLRRETYNMISFKSAFVVLWQKYFYLISWWPKHRFWIQSIKILYWVKVFSESSSLFTKLQKVVCEILI